MQIERLKLSNLKIDDRYVISRPVKPELHKVFLTRFSNFPPISVNREKIVISGHDSYEFLKKNGEDYLEVIVSDTDVKSSLFHAYNFREILKPLTLFEKLSFLKNILKYSDVSELYERTKIGIKIDDILRECLPIMTGDTFSDLLKEDSVSLKTAIRICFFEIADRGILIEFFSGVRYSSSNQLIFLDMISEICFRDKSNVEEVLNKIGYKELCSYESPQSRIMKSLYQLRFPAYSEMEKDWRSEIQGIKIPYRFTIKHPPFFEKKGVELTIFLDSLDLVKEVADKIRS